jgi:putative SOS response-associated peptidase YedK
MRWGLIPVWAKDDEAIGLGSRMINARVESVAEKPSFKRAVAARRCIVPMSSFFEWHTDDQGVKSPYRIYAREGEFLAAAGIWEEWKRHGTAPKIPERLTTFSMLTRDANSFMSGIHHRMPVLLEPKKVDHWLDPSIHDGGAAVHVLPLGAAGVPALQADRVSRLVNSPKNDIPQIWKPED